MWKLSVEQNDDDLILRNGNGIRAAVAAAMVANSKTIRAAQILATDAWDTMANKGGPWLVALRDGRTMKVEAS